MGKFSLDGTFCLILIQTINCGRAPQASPLGDSGRRRGAGRFMNSYRFHPLRWSAGTVSHLLHNQFHHLLIFSHKQMASPRSLRPSDGSVWRSLRASFSPFRAKLFRCHWFLVASFRAPNEVKRARKREEKREKTRTSNARDFENDDDGKFVAVN